MVANVATLTANNANNLNGKTENNLNVNNAATAYGKNEIQLNVNSAINANNSAFLGGVPAASYVNTSGNYTVSGNINFTGANTYFNSNVVFAGNTISVGANAIVNTSALFVGNSSANAYLVVNSTAVGLYVNGQVFQSGGGYYKGNLGAVGNTNNKSNLFRINSNNMNTSITISAGENALVTGPISIETGFTLTIDTGGRAVID